MNSDGKLTPIDPSKPFHGQQQEKKPDHDAALVLRGDAERNRPVPFSSSIVFCRDPRPEGAEPPPGHGPFFSVGYRYRSMT